MKTRRRTEDDEDDLTPEALAMAGMKAQIQELRARVSELEDWFARCTCGAAARAGRDLATAKQLAYIRSLAIRTGTNAVDIARERFGTEDLPDLTVEQASELIDMLQPGKK